MDTQYFFGKRKVATTVAFVLRSPSGTDSDTFYYATGDSGDALAQGDCFIFQDGAYDGTADNAPAEVTSGSNEVSIYTLQLSAAEMDCNYVDVIISDQSATAFRDAHLKILTEVNLGNVDIDASQGSNLTALKLTGQGTGHGLEAIGGATGQDINGVLGEHALHQGTCGAANSGTTVKLDTGASQTSDYYNGAILLLTGGTGAGQARVIVDYSFSTYGLAVVNKALSTATDDTTTFTILPGSDPWAISPGAELSAMPTKTSNFADMLQWLFERFAYKRDMSTSAFQMYNEAGDTVKFDSTGNTDVGGTQTFNTMDDA